jgi:tetratricopeptide (TPR) repeat protein
MIPLSLCANTFEHYFNQGVAFVHEEKRIEAIAALEKAAQLNPTNPQTYFNIGLIQYAMGDYQTSKSNLEKAIYYNPEYTKAHTTLAHVYEALNLPKDAINSYQKAISLGNHTTQTYAALAKLYMHANDHIRGFDYMHKALALEPNNINILFELGYFYAMQEQYDQAAEYYKKVLAINPSITDATNNLAHILRTQGNFPESREYYKQIITARPDYAPGLYGYAECCLMLGDFTEGWRAFESRWKRDTDYRHFADKLWNGSSLKGKTIILRAEYGQGDTFQFIRYAPLLKQQGARVILEAQHSLITLLAHCPYLDQVIPVDDNGAHLPSHDFQIPLMSLPYRFNTTLETIPCPIPYIQVPAPVRAQWKDHFKEEDSFKIGICWQGSPYYEQFKSAHSKKAIPLTTFLPLASVPGVTLYSLQKMNGTEQLQEINHTIKIHDFGPNFDQSNGRFVDTAGVIENMDLVITTDTSVAHLAGALGKPVWVLLPFVADWRWMLNRSDSPWYPSMRLFRQTQTGGWETVMKTVIDELHSLRQKKRTTALKKTISVMAEVQIGELIDKITILQIKKERIKDAAKLMNIETELSTLLTTYTTDVPQTLDIEELWKLLKTTNEALWTIEDDIREKERKRTFDQEFINLARSVYYTNDERCRIKRDINMLTGSRLIEEKSYTDYIATQPL